MTTFMSNKDKKVWEYLNEVLPEIEAAYKDEIIGQCESLWEFSEVHTKRRLISDKIKKCQELVKERLEHD